MKNMLITIVLIALAIGLSAQTGMFGLSYGQSMDGAINMLKAKGFTVSAKYESMADLSNPSIKDFKRVRLFFYEKKLSSWYIFMNANNNPGLKARVIKDLEALHGKGQIWDDYSEEWGWKLNDDHGVYIEEDTEENELIIKYSYWEEVFGTDEDDWWW